MTTLTALIRKEFRQQGALTVAMVFFCLLLQLTAYLLTLFPELGIRTEPSYFAIAVFVTALFTGAATAISFSGEQEDGTFGFLRSLPIPARSILMGKTAWILIGTLLVFAGTGLITLLWLALSSGASGLPPLSPDEVMGMFGVGIVEAFAWGLFWSPRCRSQIHALLATYFCASSVGYFAAIFSGGGTFSEVYCNAVPLRLGIAALVAVAGIVGANRWFDRWVQRRSDFGAGGLGVFFKRPAYPKSLQRPFFALLHQSIRQSQTMLLNGTAVVFVLCCCCCFYAISPSNYNRIAETVSTLTIFMAIGVSFFCIIYCGSVFAQDQKNESFRFLARCGVSPRQVWWSRVLPFLLVFCLLIPALTAMILYDPEWDLKMISESRLVRFLIVFSTVSTLCLVPFSVGTFLSISIRRPIVAIALTGAGTAALFGWAFLGFLLCRFNILWTTLPLCLGLLVASRLRTGDWLRQRQGFACRFRSFVPVLAVTIAIFTAMPLVRIYSIPYVSLDEIELLFTRFQMAEQMSPEERTARFKELRERLDMPLDDRQWMELRDRTMPYAFIPPIHQYPQMLKDYRDRKNIAISRTEEITTLCKESERFLEMIPTYDTFLLDYYELWSRSKTAKQFEYITGYDNEIYNLALLHLPWEKIRFRRKTNAYIYMTASFFEANRMGKSELPGNNKVYGFSWKHKRERYWCGIMDPSSGHWTYGVSPDYYSRISCGSRMSVVRFALFGWYLAHEETLPDSLDALVGTYLERLPTDPFSGGRVMYNNKYDFKMIEENRHKPFEAWGYQSKPGWPGLTLGSADLSLDFLPGYEEYGK